MNSPKISNCYNCVNFFITWDKKFPYGCKAFGMKSKKLPSLEVSQTTGEPCLLFTEKNKPLHK